MSIYLVIHVIVFNKIVCLQYSRQYDNCDLINNNNYNYDDIIEEVWYASLHIYNWYIVRQVDSAG